MIGYAKFIDGKTQYGADSGFEPTVMPECLFDFQKHMVDWAVRKGRAALFADCGLGKTLMQLTWAQNIVEHTNRSVLLLTPLAVSAQTLQEASKFDFDAERSRDGSFSGSRIVITNYEQLAKFDCDDFSGVVCDESSILKNFDGKRKAEITGFMRTVPYRLLCTATAAPNDFDELGTSSEAIGYMGYQDMLSMFFRQQTNKDHLGWGRTKFILRSHAQEWFWRWVCSWCRPMRKPSDYGFDDGDFNLPPCEVRQEVIKHDIARKGMLFSTPATTMQEQREERRLTIRQRCELASELASNHPRSVLWCHLNDEGDLLESIVPNSIQVSGSDSDDEKEEKLMAFTNGEVPRLITKPRIGGFGMNWQHCSHTVTFPSHSFEQYYQCIRRFLRFGQRSPVKVDIVTTHGEETVLKNLIRKTEQADEMFNQLLKYVTYSLSIENATSFNTKQEAPEWL